MRPLNATEDNVIVNFANLLSNFQAADQSLGSPQFNKDVFLVFHTFTEPHLVLARF